MIQISEVIRYLGYGKNMPDESVMELICESIAEVERAAEPRCIYRRYPVTIEGNCVCAAGLRLESQNLSKNLTGCSEVIFFAATLGINVDRLLNRNLKLKISKAAVIQATAAAYIEDYIDTWQAQMAFELEKEGYYLRQRFSPGYGDLSLDIQSDFLQTLEATKRIGITLSEGGIMLPEKSVTAIIGLSTTNTHCHVIGCELCENVNCDYRRNK